MRSPRLLALALALGAFAPPPAGAAPHSSEQSRAAARALADRGYELYAAGEYAEALAAFREAERHYPAPSILLMVARTFKGLRRLLEARSVYERVVAEKLDSSAPRAFIEAQEMAKGELTALMRRIPMLQIAVAGARTEEVTITVDGVAAPANAEPLPKDPGTYTVVVRVPGQAPVERAVTLEEGRTERLTVDFSRPETTDTPPPAAPSAGGSLVPAAVAFSVAGVGVGVGAITGILAKVAVDDIKSRCTDGGHCLREDEPKAAQAQTFITVSTIGFVAGGAAAVTGVALLLLRPGAAPPEPRSEGASVRVLVGPGSAHLVGRF